MDFAGFVIAIQFLTVAPPLLRRDCSGPELGRAVGWFAAVGLALGGLLAGLASLLGRAFPAPLAAALVLAAWVVATGALHLDGFLDACDGLMGGHTVEARLRIMRDERVGAFAVAGGVLLLLVKYSAIASARERTAALVLAPTLGRWSMAWAVVGYPYIRPEGLGRAMKDHAGWPQAALATAVAATAALLIGGLRGGLALVLAAALTWAGARFVLARLPGFTGDLYGALCEVVEAAALLPFAATG